MAEDADVTEAPVVEAEVTPEADPIMDILMAGELDTAKAESSPAKTEAPEVTETETDGKVADVADDTAETAPDETPVQPLGKAEERKTQLNTEIRDLVAQRNALKTDIEKVNAEVYQPATEDELVGQPIDPDEPDSPVYTAWQAKVEAERQQNAIERYNNQVAEAQLIIESDSQAVLRDYPIFNPDSPDYNKDVAEQAAGLVNDLLIRDPNTNQITGTNVPIKSLYKTIAAAHNVSAQAGQLKGQQDTEKMLARADDTGSAAPKVEKKDPIMEVLLSDDY